MKKILLAAITLTAASLFAATPGNVIITEIMETPNQTMTQYIELYNTTGSEIVMNNWTITSMSTGPSTFSGTIPSHQFFVISDFNDLDGNGFPTDSIYTGSFYINTSSMTPIEVKDNVGTTIATLTIDSSIPATVGVSREIQNVAIHALGTTLLSSYFNSTTTFGTDSGSPKTAGSTPVQDWQLY